MIEIFLLFTTFLFFFFSAHLWKENQELKRKLTKTNNKEKDFSNEGNDVYGIEKISHLNPSTQSKEALKKDFQKVQEIMEKSHQSEKKTQAGNQPTKIYTIPQKEPTYHMNNLQAHANLNSEQLNFQDFIQEQEERKIVNTRIQNQPMDYLQNLSKKLEEEIKPQTIELTDYEKRQEENAIISYQELLSSHENQSQKEEKYDEEQKILEELKRFRDDLN